MDIVSDALAMAGVRGSSGARIAASAPWGAAWGEDRNAVVYGMVAGTAYLTVASEPPRLVGAGDVLLLPTSHPHSLSSEPGIATYSCDLAAAETARKSGFVLRLGAGDIDTQILGASYSHDSSSATPVFSLLPNVVHLRAPQADPNLTAVMQLLGRELAYPGIAGTFLLDRLIDVLLVHVLRAWLASGDPVDVSWWGALRDPILAHVVELIHEQPARQWTAESLAREVTTSKQTLSRRFITATGMTPGAYLMQWRMSIAARLLRDSDESLESVAASVGYTSVYAFSRAFHRERDIPPARFRHESRNSTTLHK